MMIVVAKFRVIVGALAFLVMALGAQPASAQQPTSVNPQASAVKEDQLFQELNRISGRCTAARSEGLHDRAARRP